MQAIAPDFYVPFDGTSQANNQERPGDGLFGALLRDEEARYERELQAAREYPGAARDDLGRDEPLREEPVREEPVREEPVREEPVREEPLRDEPLRDERAEHPENPADDRDVVHEARSSQGDDSRRPGDDDQPAASQDVDSMSEAGAEGDSDATVPPAEVPADGAGKQADTGLNNGPAPIQQVQAAAATVLTGKDAKTAEPTTAAGSKTDAMVSGTAASALAATAQSTATTPEASSRKTTAQPANGAVAPQPVAEKTSPTASAKVPEQVTTASRQSTAVSPEAPVENGNRPSGRTAGSTPGADQGHANPANESLSSRPSATLGGGAATAAMAQPDKAAGSNKTHNNPNATEIGPQGTGDKAVQQSQQAGKTTATATDASSDKVVRANLAAAPTGGDAAGTTASNGSTPTTTPVGGAALNSGGVQSGSFAEVMANARPGTSASPAEQIAVQVRSAQVAGKEQINIKLHPAELGRIEVKLESGSDGTIRASISADRSDTLDLLQRDARGLERALQDAGVKTDSGSLSFNLRGQGQEQQADGDDAPRRTATDDNTLAADSGDPAAPEYQQRQSSHDGALDIRV